MPKIFKEQASMNVGKESTFVNILSNNNIFEFTLDMRVLEWFRLLRGLLWPLQLQWKKSDFAIQCYVTNYKADHKLYFNKKKVYNKNTMYVQNCIDVWEASCFAVVKRYFKTSYEWGIWRGRMKNVQFCWDWSKIDWDIDMFFWDIL